MNKVAAFSNAEFHWVCDICQYEWYALPSVRMLGSRCVSCHPTGTSIEERMVMALIAEILDVDIYLNVRLASRVVTDGFISEFNTAIDYDGIYWHAQDGSVEKDTRKSKLVTDLGYRMVRLRSNPLPHIEGAENVSGEDGCTFTELALAAADIIDPGSAPHGITDTGIDRAQVAARQPMGPRALIHSEPTITDKVEVQLVERNSGT